MKLYGTLGRRLNVGESEALGWPMLLKSERVLKCFQNESLGEVVHEERKLSH